MLQTNLPSCRTAVSSLLSDCLAASLGVSKPPPPSAPILCSARGHRQPAQRRGAAARLTLLCLAGVPGSGVTPSRAALRIFYVDFAASDTNRSAERSSYLLHSHQRAVTCWRCSLPCCLPPRISSPAPPPDVSPTSLACAGLSSVGHCWWARGVVLCWCILGKTRGEMCHHRGLRNTSQPVHFQLNTESSGDKTENQKKHSKMDLSRETQEKCNLASLTRAAAC